MTIELNSEQQAGVEAVDGNWVMIAGPGSGKTRVLVERYMRMRMRGIPDRDILNLTFTNAAAKEMADRVGLLNSDQVFRTFHSFCLELLKQERRFLPFKTVDSIIPVRGEQFALMKDLLKTYRGIRSYKSLSDRISEWKCANVSPEVAIEIAEQGDEEDYFCANAYSDYERRSREEGWLDFDSLVKETVALLEVNEDAKRRAQRKYLAVDECQDTDVTQFRLLRLLYSGNVFAVGDANQLIYEWRSAQSGNLSSFERLFPGTKTLYLGQNYRSTQKLVEFFKQILPVDNGLASHMVSQRPLGEDVRFLRYWSEDHEANEVLNEITGRGIVDEAAVLARTNRQLQLIQRRAMSRNIKTEILGRKNVWQENEVKHLLELLRDEILDQRPAAIVAQELIRMHNFAHRYQGTKNNTEKDPVENLNDVVRMAARKNKATGQPLTILEFLEWVRKITHMRRSKSEPILSLVTVHQAKGREWKHVFVVGANQGTMPHKDGELLEEHRIFFVACSRAADTLQISFFKSPSQFLNAFRGQIEEVEL